MPPHLATLPPGKQIHFLPSLTTNSQDSYLGWGCASIATPRGKESDRVPSGSIVAAETGLLKILSAGAKFSATSGDKSIAFWESLKIVVPSILIVISRPFSKNWMPNARSEE